MDPILVGKAVTHPDSLAATGGRVFLQPEFGNVVAGMAAGDAQEVM
jgi:hypothetical protein